MAVIHFLNVKEGDCSVIQHNSGRVSVIDVCNAGPVETAAESMSLRLGTLEAAITKLGGSGNYNQKAYPVNPVSYLTDRSIWSVFRFVLTHPDMDHMDGIKYFFEYFSPGNFWDTDNEEKKEDWGEGSPFNEDDWRFYESLRNGKPESDPKRLTLFSGSSGFCWNRDGQGNPGGDGIQILAPTPELVADANETGDYNDCSYVLLYLTANRKIVFGGDSHDKTWEHILDAHPNVKDVDLLIAPHHGRKSGRSYEFLDVLKPKMTFFGNARSEHLAYGAWSSRDLLYITNNQAGCMVAVPDDGSVDYYVTNKSYAESVAAKLGEETSWHPMYKAYSLLSLP